MTGMTMNNDGKSVPLAYRLARRERKKGVQRCLTILKSLLSRDPHAHRIWSGPLKGRRIITSWFDYPAAIMGLTERPLLEWFEHNVRTGETWLDVGAHYGYTALALCKQVGPTGRVFAFEPMLATSGHLAGTRSINNLRQLTILPLALDASQNLALGGFRTIRGMVDSTLDPQHAAHSNEEWLETTLSAPLDWLWPRLSGDLDQLDGLKVDVQGMEIAAIRGMSGVLAKHRPKLVLEVHRGVPRPELLALLAEIGYTDPGIPIEPVPDEVAPQYLDDRSYAFFHPARAC
jgi:FkbM family methyltransferase